VEYTCYFISIPKFDLGLVKKQLHVFRMQALPTGETTAQNHELIFLQPLGGVETAKGTNN
jgi:hypothetical protein